MSFCFPNEQKLPCYPLLLLLHKSPDAPPYVDIHNLSKRRAVQLIPLLIGLEIISDREIGVGVIISSSLI
jgi:hypothetical protein